MNEVLAQLGIRTNSVNRAIQDVDYMDSNAIDAFLDQMGVRVEPEDVNRAAKVAIQAIMTGHDMTPDKVSSFVYRRVGERKTPDTVRAPVNLAPAVGFRQDGPVSVTPVMAVFKDADVPVKGKRGRKRMGNSAFDKAVKLLDEHGPAPRSTLIDLLMANGINKSSAGVYLWKYNKGER